MTPTSYKLTIIAAVMFAPVTVTGAQAQWYSSYPSGQSPSVNAQQPYAVEVSPGTYVIHRPNRGRTDVVDQPADERPHQTHVDPALIDELARRHKKHKDISVDVVNTKKVVIEKPVVIEHKHVVDGRPRVIERRHITEDSPGRGLIHPRRDLGTEEVVVDPGEQETDTAHLRKSRHVTRDVKVREVKIKETGRGRVIRAEAEVTILGPDRMSIRLFRKGHGGKDANAEVVE